MYMRLSRSTVRFLNAFAVPGYPGELPAGDYEIVVEEELLQGLSFEAYRRTGTFLMVRGEGARAGRIQKWVISESDLNEALIRDTVHEHPAALDTDASPARAKRVTTRKSSSAPPSS